METIAELVGGPCDGVQLDPPDKEEPDDWPDWLNIRDVATGTIEEYHLDLERGPELKDGFRIYYYQHDSLLDS